ncbi:MAG TPA: hypothetical protein VLG66_14755 [Alphaproteobacteria bacterium]|nr:hypothetical protein [Alphaproteobacteria bacterium]
MTKLSRFTAGLLGATALSLAFAVAPVSFDPASGKFASVTADARGGGNGGDNGNAGGNGQGNGHGNGGAAADGGRGGPGNGYGRDNAPGQVGKSDVGQSTADQSRGRGHGNAFGHSTSETAHGYSNHGALASALGSLNAAHALSKGNTPPASPNSVVGQLAAYRDAMNEAIAAPTQQARDAALQDAEESLQAAANKDVTDETRSAVNDMLGIDTAALDSPPGAQ